MVWEDSSMTSHATFDVLLFSDYVDIDGFDAREQGISIHTY